MKRTTIPPLSPQPELFYEVRLVDECADWHELPIVRSKSRLEVLNLFCTFDGYEEARRSQKPLYVGERLRVEMVAIVGDIEIILSEQSVDEMDEIDRQNA
jgi:hypothetical protein